MFIAKWYMYWLRLGWILFFVPLLGKQFQLNCGAARIVAVSVPTLALCCIILCYRESRPECLSLGESTSPSDIWFLSQKIYPKDKFFYTYVLRSFDLLVFFLGSRAIDISGT